MKQTTMTQQQQTQNKNNQIDCRFGYCLSTSNLSLFCWFLIFKSWTSQTYIDIDILLSFCWYPQNNENDNFSSPIGNNEMVVVSSNISNNEQTIIFFPLMMMISHWNYHYPYEAIINKANYPLNILIITEFEHMNWNLDFHVSIHMVCHNDIHSYFFLIIPFHWLPFHCSFETKMMLFFSCFICLDNIDTLISIIYFLSSFSLHLRESLHIKHLCIEKFMDNSTNQTIHHW